MTLYDTPIPGASAYGESALRAKTAYQNALARLNQQRSQSLRQYGYQGDIDQQTGVLSNMRVDPNNPYGAYQQQRQQHAYQLGDARDQAISRGLAGGLAKQMAQRLRSGFGAENAGLGQDLIGTLGGYQDVQNQAGYDRDAALWEAEREAARGAIEGGQFNPADFSGLDYPDWQMPEFPEFPSFEFPGDSYLMGPKSSLLKHPKVKAIIKAQKKKIIKRRPVPIDRAAREGPQRPVKSKKKKGGR